MVILSKQQTHGKTVGVFTKVMRHFGRFEGFHVKQLNMSISSTLQILPEHVPPERTSSSWRVGRIC